MKKTKPQMGLPLEAQADPVDAWERAYDKSGRVNGKGRSSGSSEQSKRRLVGVERLQRSIAEAAPSGAEAPAMFEIFFCGFCGSQTTLTVKAGTCDQCGAVLMPTPGPA